MQCGHPGKWGALFPEAGNIYASLEEVETPREQPTPKKTVSPFHRYGYRFLFLVIQTFFGFFHPTLLSYDQVPVLYFLKSIYGLLIYLKKNRVL